MSLQQSEKINELTAALCAAQMEMTNPKKDCKNPYFKNEYAGLGSILDSCRKTFPKNGLAFTQPITMISDKPYLITTIMHTSGQWINSVAPILCKDPNDPQKMGSAITYMRRYALQALIGVTGDDDDDAQQAITPAKEPEKKKINEDQIEFLNAVFDECDPDFVDKALSALKKSSKIQHIGELDIELYDRVLKAAVKNRDDKKQKISKEA